MDKVRLNLCRIYLQALTISDIMAVGGVRLLDSALKGNRDTTRTSTLCWPNQGRPCEQDWRLCDTTSHVYLPIHATVFYNNHWEPG